MAKVDVEETKKGLKIINTGGACTAIGFSCNTWPIKYLCGNLSKTTSKKIDIIIAIIIERT